MTFSISRRALLEGGLCAAAAAAGAGTMLLLNRPAKGRAADGLPVTGQPLAQPHEVRSKNRLLATDIHARYARHDLAGRPVHLRGYDGLPVGRTLRLRAGDELRLHLHNDLPWEAVEGTCTTRPDRENVPHAFNATNMHLHGLHVSPMQPGDDILLTLAPKPVSGLEKKQTLPSDYRYAYQIPADHPPGTYWYHAHHHGSVALQVSSGMAGCLIVEGAVDDIPEIRAAREVVLMVQSQTVDPDGTCEREALLEQSGPTYVNAQLQPVLTMKPGEVQRWRVVNATHDRSLWLAPPDVMGTALLCTDGNPLPAAKALTGPMRLVPGNRADLLVRAPQRAGRYAVDGGPNIGTLFTIVVHEAPALDQVLFTGALPSYRALEPIRDEEVTMGRRLEFGMTGGPPHPTYTINGVPFTCRDPWEIPLGAVEEWEIYNQTNEIHPFHIHVNPFQMLSGGLVEPGLWLDTVELPPNKRVRFRTRFADFRGTFVFHCHTLQHEDMGMMQAITVT
ncbi:multicopper oxidase domain-containing protein [Azospirillum sp. SYSU D00513]|uniref:multicopper oxidase family protein n=1 Tax=Azospirillum sp. SYSU D00513 TaxID=2812561 RepID=UPI001A957E75|nr:multicopper oxidase domain-containing protein [Azospirillum sp. SYSU D00513]